MLVQQSPDLFTQDDNGCINEKENADGVMAREVILEDNSFSQNVMVSYNNKENTTKNTEKENENGTVHKQIKIKKYVRETNRKDGAQNIVHSKRTRNINQSFKDHYQTLIFNLSVL